MATPTPDNDDHKSKSQQQGSSSTSVAAATDSHPPGSAAASDPNRPPYNDNAPNPPPPQAMGYPPVIGYPPNGQQTYPPYNGYPYGGQPPPPHGYYPNNVPHMYPHSQQGISSSGFVRGVLTGLIALVIMSCMASIITYLILRPEAPVFRVVSLSVNNFNISNSVLMGDWSTELAVSNPNDKLTAYFYRINSFVYYRDPKNYLAYNTEVPLGLNTNENGTMKVKLTMVNSEQPPDGVITELEKERATGTVRFGFGMGMLGTFRSGSWWSNHLSMKVYCDYLSVGFVGATGTGSLLPSYDRNRQCAVYT